MDRVAQKLTKVVTASTKGIAFETASLARFSDGACICSLGDTSVLVTAVSEIKKTPQGAKSFVPLTVDYRQKAAAAGRIPMTHLRRDIGITERETLTGRMIDRSIRPMFTKGFTTETQLICNLLAVDGINDPEVLAINGASASLAISDIPWNGPVGAVRMGLIGERTVANPTRKELEESRMNLVVAANQLGNVMMLDGSSREPILMPDMMKVIKNAIKECRLVIDSIKKLQKAQGKVKRAVDLSHLPTTEQREFVSSFVREKLEIILSTYSLDKQARGEAIDLIRVDLLEAAKQKYPDVDTSTWEEAFVYSIRDTYTALLLKSGIRCDGRQLSELRPIDCKINLHKPLHGSALFQRGQTQVFCSTTFDSPDAAFRTDSLTSIVSGIKEKNFMLHYEFPPFATNEVGRVGTMPGRREIGHGALAEKSIRPIVPEDHEMTIRLNCEVLESNGSSSMASVSAGSLALMDAGVKLKEHVAGVAMGLISKDNVVDQDNSLVLTDISGFEDFFGDMDFKIAGTKKGLTALQLDVKPMNGVPSTVLFQAIKQAHMARAEIIAKMEAVISLPKTEQRDNHPVIKTIQIPMHKISTFIGFGGSNLKKLMATIGVRVSSQADSVDKFVVFAPNKDAMDEAEEYIKTIMDKQKEPELVFNGIYDATIVEIRPNGVMVTLYDSMRPTLLNLSQLDIRHVEHPSALNLEVGQQIQVKYFGRDPATGHMRLSRKSLLMSGVSRIYRTPPA